MRFKKILANWCLQQTAREAKTQVLLRQQPSPTLRHLSGANQAKINETTGIANILKKQITPARFWHTNYFQPSHPISSAVARDNSTSLVLSGSESIGRPPTD